MTENLSLQRILEAFNAPINEEQGWAVCYQCAGYLLQGTPTVDGKDDRRDPVDAVPGPSDALAAAAGSSQQLPRGSGTGAADVLRTHTVVLWPDGNVSSVAGYTGTALETSDGERELVRALGMMIFSALDYGLGESEEQKLSRELEGLIDQMTNGGDRDHRGDVEGDEGIEDDADEKENGCKGLSLCQVMKICSEHVDDSIDAAAHYKAVCRALVAEVIELSTFLEKIYDEKERLQVIQDESAGGCMHHLEALQKTDWARLWIQIMKELRQGVKLKKVQTMVKHSVEYELTPYEILMDDLRYRRYTLNKVPLDEEMMPQKVKKDVHAIILEFIRSRPPLHPVHSRRLLSPPLKSPDVREQLMEAIRSEHRLKPTPGRIVETSRTKLDDTDSTPKPSKKIIKPDLTLLMSNSFDDECENDSDDDNEDKNRVVAVPVAPFTPLSPKSPPRHLPWQQTDAPDHLSDPANRERRNSISVCESPGGSGPSDSLARDTSGPATIQPSKAVSIQSQVDKFMAADFSNIRSLQSSLECLSLTVEEVMHIRNVLTKAELECLSVDPELHALLSNGKVCFTCKKTKFSLFGTWATTCKFCRRSVCSLCVRKMKIPTEHFEHIPVYTLSPSPGSPLNEVDSVYDITGSMPSSPDFTRKLSPMQLEEPKDSTPTGGMSRLAATIGYVSQGRKRAPLQRAQTSVRGPIPARALDAGPTMSICRDCRAMIVSVIKASRRSLAAAPQGTAAERVYSDCPSRKPSRNFHLDLKPVYKERKA